jgi:hypothetical protein
MSWAQADLFGPSTDVLHGIEVKLQRHCECGREIFRVGLGTAMHRASLHCTACGKHGGWMSHESGRFLEKIVGCFGRPNTPIVVRNAQDAAET